MTRDEFEGLLDSYEIELGQTADSYEFNVPAGDPDAARAAILAAYDAQAARIAELEAACEEGLASLNVWMNEFGDELCTVAYTAVERLEDYMRRVIDKDAE